MVVPQKFVTGWPPSVSIVTAAVADTVWCHQVSKTTGTKHGQHEKPSNWTICQILEKNLYNNKYFNKNKKKLNKNNNFPSLM